MGKIVTVPRIGTGVEGDEFRPDTDSKWWQMVEEREDEFVIEILD